MKSRYNLRIQSSKLPIPSIVNRVSSASPRITKKTTLRQLRSKNRDEKRRHSLRLNPIVKKVKARALNRATPAQWHQVDQDVIDVPSISNEKDDDDDDYQDLLSRHHRRMLEEQKDRKLYERYVRGQRTLRRLQCRRTHTAHLSEATRNRLLRELERERRYTVHDQICSYLADHTLLFRHRHQCHSHTPIDWSILEEELPRTNNHETVRQLDVMIDNLKKVIHNAKSKSSKPRLSVHERRKQRLAAGNPSIVSNNSNVSSSNEIHSNSNSLTSPSQVVFVSRFPVVRFLDDMNNHLRMNNSQHLTCIQNVLSHNNHHPSRLLTNDSPTPVGTRKQFLRPKSNHVNLSDSSQTKKRPLEKENCSLVTSSHSSINNVVLRATSPMISVKSSRTYPNTRKHPMNNNNTLVTRRQTRLSANA